MTDHRPLLRRLVFLVLLALLASIPVTVFALVASVLIYGFPTNYKQELLASLTSPSGEWAAIVTEDDFDASIFSEITDSVTIVSTAYPTWSINLLWIDTRGHDEDRPRIAWSSSNVLRVTVPNISIIKVPTRHAGGIDVDLHFEPDDPAARAAWLKKIGESPE
jgi:hypothetical protein